MTPEQSKALVNRMIQEIQNEKHIELCDELFAPTFVNHTPPRGMSNDREGMRRLFAMTHAAFPDGRIAVDDQIAESGRVWTRKTFTGTHTGVFASAAPTGKVVTYQVIDILAMRDGKMTEHWSVLDRLDLFRQLGLL